MHEYFVKIIATKQFINAFKGLFYNRSYGNIYLVSVFICK